MARKVAKTGRCTYILIPRKITKNIALNQRGMAILNKYISNFSGNNSRSTSPAPEAKKEDEKTSKAEKRKQMVDSLLDPNAEPSSTKKGHFEGLSIFQKGKKSIFAPEKSLKLHFW